MIWQITRIYDKVQMFWNDSKEIKLANMASAD